MTTRTLTLTEFLLARIAEDEAAALAASPPPWSYPGIDSVAGGTLYDATRRIVDVVYEQESDHNGTIVRHLLVPEADANGFHIARHDPARVLAECEAKRRIVEWCSERDRVYIGTLATDIPREKDFVPGALVHQTDAVMLRFLALPYADHVQYQEEWRP